MNAASPAGGDGTPGPRGKAPGAPEGTIEPSGAGSGTRGNPLGKSFGDCSGCAAAPPSMTNATATPRATARAFICICRVESVPRVAADMSNPSNDPLDVLLTGWQSRTLNLIRTGDC
jgi:hypothetical protein